MGFFNSLFEGAVGASLDLLVKKYEAMDDSELKREWKEKFEYRSLEDTIQADSPLGVLDEVYAKRFYVKSWRQKSLEAQRRSEETRKKAEQERKNKEEEIRRKKEEEKRIQEDAERFIQALESSEMAKIIVNIINKYSYEVSNVYIEEDVVELYDEDDEIIETIRYKKYGYPNLDEVQMYILTEYLLENIKLKFIKLDNFNLELNDAPGGIRESW